MANVKRVLGLLAVLALSTAHTARAQAPSPSSDKFFVNINIGGQVASRAKVVSTAASMTVYDETATLTSTQPVNWGMTIDCGAGYQVYKDVYAGLVVTRFSDLETATTTASIPDLLFFYRPTIETGTTEGLRRSELTVAPHIAYTMALSDKLDIVVAAGVSMIRLRQDLVRSFRVAANTQNVTISATTESGMSYGPYAGAAVILTLRPHYGIGGFLRYAGGKVTTTSLTDVSVGGGQAGAGIWLRF